MLVYDPPPFPLAPLLLKHRCWWCCRCAGDRSTHLVFISDRKYAVIVCCNPSTLATAFIWFHSAFTDGWSRLVHSHWYILSNWIYTRVSYITTCHVTSSILLLCTRKSKKLYLSRMIWWFCIMICFEDSVILVFDQGDRVRVIE